MRPSKKRGSRTQESPRCASLALSRLHTSSREIRATFTRAYRSLCAPRLKKKIEKAPSASVPVFYFGFQATFTRAYRSACAPRLQKKTKTLCAQAAGRQPIPASAGFFVSQRTYETQALLQEAYRSLVERGCARGRGVGGVCGLFSAPPPFWRGGGGGAASRALPSPPSSIHMDSPSWASAACSVVLLVLFVRSAW